MNTNNLLEITKRQAIKLFNEGKVVYIATNDQPVDCSFNTFIMRKDYKDAKLNFSFGQRQPSEVPLEEYISFLERNQAEPIYFYTLNSSELYTLPLVNISSPSKEKNLNRFFEQKEKFKKYIQQENISTFDLIKRIEARNFRLLDNRGVFYQTARLKTLIDVCDIFGIDRKEYNWVFTYNSYKSDYNIF